MKTHFNKLIKVFLLCAVFLVTNMKGFSSPVSITVDYKNAKLTDSLSLFIINPLYGMDLNERRNVKREIVGIRDNEGCFYFQFQTENDIEYFIIKISNFIEDPNEPRPAIDQLIPLSFFEPNDKIKISIFPRSGEKRFNGNLYQRYKYSYEGKGSQKLKLLCETDSVRRAVGDKGLPVFDGDFAYHDPFWQSTSAALNHLKNSSESISSLAYSILRADLLFQNSDSRFSAVRSFFKVQQTPLPGYKLLQLQHAYNAGMDTLFNKHIPEYTLGKSYYYLQHINYKSDCDVLFNTGSSSPQKVFNRIIAEYEGESRDRALIYNIAYGYSWDSGDGQIKSAEKIIKTDYCMTELAKLANRYKGGNFYSLLLTNTQGKKIEMSGFKNKVLILDIWYTGCGACAKLYKEVLSKAENEFKDNGKVVFLSVSIDKDFQKWRSSVSSGMYTSNYAVNLYTDGEGVKHPINDNLKIQSYPTLMTLARSGEVLSFQNFELMNSHVALIAHIRKALAEPDF